MNCAAGLVRSPVGTEEFPRLQILDRLAAEIVAGLYESLLLIASGRQAAERHPCTESKQVAEKIFAASPIVIPGVMSRSRRNIALTVVTRSPTETDRWWWLRLILIRVIRMMRQMAIWCIVPLTGLGRPKLGEHCTQHDEYCKELYKHRNHLILRGFD